MRVFAFDSGVGGLSVLPPLFAKNPKMKVFYLGDLAHLPYGTKSAERVRDLTLRNLRWLLDQHSFSAENGDYCLVACNTASAEALEYCQKNLGHKLPLVGVIEASCRAAIATQSSSITVLATQATVKSLAYERALRNLGFQGKIQQFACPLFVPFVEERITEGPALDWVIQRYLEGRVQADDCIVLGCTHYPYLLDSLKKHFPNVNYVQAGSALSDFEKTIQGSAHDRATLNDGAQLEIFVTDSNVQSQQISFYLEKLGLSKINWSCRQVAPVE